MEPFIIFTIVYGGTGVIANSILIVVIILKSKYFLLLHYCHLSERLPT